MIYERRTGFVPRGVMIIDFDFTDRKYSGLFVGT